MSTSFILCHAQLLSPYEQAYGRWNVRLTRNIFGRRWHLETLDDTTSGRRSSSRRAKSKDDTTDLQLIFPVILRNVYNESQAQPPHSRFKHTTTRVVKCVDCILTLEKNGRFTLCIADDYDGDDDDKFKSSAISETNNIHQQHPTSLHHSPLEGEWYLSPNPYCVTDRHYDTIALISEPRLRRVHLAKTTMVEKARVELRCKLWGRYGAGAIRYKLGLGHGRTMGRMTHGTVMIVRELADNVGISGNAKELPKREIMGTFQGRAMVEDLQSNNRDELYADEDSQGDLFDEEVVDFEDEF